MVVGFSMELEGGREIDRKLQTLEPRVAKKHLTKALRAGAKIVLAEAKATAPEVTGRLRRSLVIRAARARRGRHEKTIQVFPSTKKEPGLVGYAQGASSDLTTRKTTGKRYYYPAAVEYGTRFIAANPFMRRAWDKTKVAMVSKIMAALRASVEQEATK